MIKFYLHKQSSRCCAVQFNTKKTFIKYFENLEEFLNSKEIVGYRTDNMPSKEEYMEIASAITVTGLRRKVKNDCWEYFV